MKFTTKNVDINMTSLVGYVNATYQQLVDTFGEPTYNGSSGEDKVDVEWHIKFDDGTVASIYNWKDYDGGDYCRSGVKYEWHIGGHARAASWAVLDALGVTA